MTDSFFLKAEPEREERCPDCGGPAAGAERLKAYAAAHPPRE